MVVLQPSAYLELGFQDNRLVVPKAGRGLASVVADRKSHEGRISRGIGPEADLVGAGCKRTHMCLDRSFHGAIEHDPAPIEDHAPLTDLAHGGHVVADEDHGPSLGLDLAELSEALLLKRGVAD